MAMTSTEKAERLSAFVSWVAVHVKGDEKGEAQIFLDRLFKGFGHDGWKEAGASCEERVKNDTGGTSFADLVWKPHVVVEMKKRGVDLSKHYAQAFTYWTYLVPNRPRYAVLCNFDEFWVYDFETQMDTPVEKLKLSELPHNYGGLNFLFPENPKPLFGNHNEAVTREAADKLAACFNSLTARGVSQRLAQRFVLQLLMSFFAEDIGLLEKYMVKTLLQECMTDADTYDKLGGLFEAMNRSSGNPGGRYKGVAYFNGGLFAEPAKIELVSAERQLLQDACDFDWSKVRPEIFGTLFEHSLGKGERHAQGAHFTSAVDIMKIVGPTIVEPWRDAINGTKTLTEMQQLAHRMQAFRILDPACGSGNFLFIAYREMKRLEAELYSRMAERFPKSVDPSQRTLGFVTTTSFYGMDINPFAVEIAKVTMMLAHKLSIDELHVSESALPLDNLDKNIIHQDALLKADGSRFEWPEADVIIGNPPFLGAKKVREELGTNYMRRVRAAYPEVPGMADFCVYWIRRAHQALPKLTKSDPLVGRAGLVGTQNIRSNKSREGGLDFVTVDGTIIEAVENQPWSGDANVHVSIVNWVKTQDKDLLPARRRLWFKTGTIPDGDAPAAKRYDLDMRAVPSINSALSDGVDLKSTAVLACNVTPKRAFQGVTPGNRNFVFTMAQAEALTAKEPAASDLLFPYFVGKEVLGGATKPTRLLLDFGDRHLLAAKSFPRALKYVEDNILPARMAAAAKGQKDETGDSDDSGGSDEEGEDSEQRSHHAQFLERWWQLSYRRGEMISELAKLKRYIACSRVTTMPIFFFVSSEVRPGDALQVFAFEDDYSFGVLQSWFHVAWFMSKRSNMKSDPRYSSDGIFGTFPWPQAPVASKVAKVAEAARLLQAVRVEALKGITGGLRELYRTLVLPGKNPLKEAHGRLDKAVADAYGFDLRKDVLQQLLSLNLSIAAQLAHGGSATSPGIPAGYPNPDKLVSMTCFG